MIGCNHTRDGKNKIVFLFHKNNSTVLTAKKGFYKSYIYKDRDNNILGRSNTKMNDEEIRKEIDDIIEEELNLLVDKFDYNISTIQMFVIIIEYFFRRMNYYLQQMHWQDWT